MSWFLLSSPVVLPFRFVRNCKLGKQILIIIIPQEIIDKTTRLENARDDLRKQVDQTNARIKGEDDTINGIEQAGGKVTADACRLREEIKELEATIEKCEDDKMTKDSQIRTLREEIAHQEDLISKLGKDKKSTAESRQKTEEDIQSAEDRCNHLSKVKGKLEQSLDECEDALEREKKSKGDAEKVGYNICFKYYYLLIHYSLSDEEED